MNCVPKILVLSTIVTMIHNEVILNLHTKKEQDIEKVNDAYLRFISGQYKLKLDKVED